MRIGYGEDTHRLEKDRKLILGGVDIPFTLGLMGHSDADVLVHSIIDALLGAAALDDIGAHFPDSNMRYKDISSLELLKETNTLLKNKGYSIVNIDSTVIAQEPKLREHIKKMRENISLCLDIDVDFVSVKATTPEKTGAEGRLECITSRAICLID